MAVLKRTPAKAAVIALVLYLIVIFYRSLHYIIGMPSTHAQLHIHPFLELRSTNSVTPIIHQSWKTRDLPTNRSQRWTNTWKTCFPDWEWRLWTDEDNLALVRDHYPWFLPVYLGFQNPVERADVARYFYMFHYGGIYSDLDNVCMKSFSHLLKSPAIVFGGMDGFGDPKLRPYVQNSFMASRPGHPFWMRLISRVMLYRHIGKKGRAEILTGPYVLMGELKEYLGTNARDVTVYPSKYFNPFSWYVNKIAACKDLGQMTNADEMACVAAFPDAYVVQFHTQSWLHGRL